MLCGRRALAANDLDKQFVTKTDVGAFEETESPIEERRAYKVFQDIGLARATKGAKVFIAMKGASDSGLFIPHSPSKFVGWDGEDLQAEELANRIFMKENCSYMEHLKENDEEKYKLQFGGYVAKKIEPGSIEAIYKNALKKIGAEGAKVEKKKAEYSGKKYENKKKISLAERKERVAARLAEE
ncbi:RL5B [Enterospora canceri]|uniref:RL5B n=1 Tax=Enterospora canceri TaxID=1081671 RepID=A0A1Y1S3W7_9MICR|nr:RL5B [Enterospora canceri]